jgi:hypothetical protein
MRAGPERRGPGAPGLSLIFIPSRPHAARAADLRQSGTQ